MSIVVANAQLQATLDWLRALRMGTSTIHLYSNDYFPTPESVVGDFTEPEWEGYSPYQLSPSDWTEPALNINGYWSMTTNSYVVINGSGEPHTLYGLFLRYPANNGALTLACRFHEPIIIEDSGGKRFEIQFIQANAPEGTFPPAVLARDEFTGEDGTDLNGRIPPVGNPWTVDAGTIQIQDNAAQSIAFTGDESLAFIDVGYANVTPQLTLLNPHPAGGGAVKLFSVQVQ